MTFTWEGALWRIRFEYGVWKRRRKTRRAVVCYVEFRQFIASDEAWKWLRQFQAVAHCSERDVFVRETGRKLALTRVLAKTERPFRSLAWAAYRTRRASPECIEAVRQYAQDAAEVLKLLSECGHPSAEPDTPCVMADAPILVRARELGLVEEDS